MVRDGKKKEEAERKPVIRLFVDFGIDCVR